MHAAMITTSLYNPCSVSLRTSATLRRKQFQTRGKGLRKTSYNTHETGRVVEIGRSKDVVLFLVLLIRRNEDFKKHRLNLVDESSMISFLGLENHIVELFVIKRYCLSQN